jgi:hypothetical protein
MEYYAAIKEKGGKSTLRGAKENDYPSGCSSEFLTYMSWLAVP